jgi:hypothetical protein
MDLLLVLFVLNSAFAAWVVFRDGAAWLRESLPAALLTDRRGTRWSVKKLRAFVAGLWGVNAWSVWVLIDG